MYKELISNKNSSTLLIIIVMSYGHKKLQGNNYTYIYKKNPSLGNLVLVLNEEDFRSLRLISFMLWNIRSISCSSFHDRPSPMLLVMR